jgi:copper chaperone CopZ
MSTTVFEVQMSCAGALSAWPPAAGSARRRPSLRLRLTPRPPPRARAGCSGACTRILKKIDGVQQVDAKVEDQKITVVHDPKVSPDDMLAALKKWGDAGGKKVALLA